MENNVITLTDENGKEVYFEFLDFIEFAGDEYVVLLPCEDDDNLGEVMILRLDSDEDYADESFSSVEDEETLQSVFEIFREKFKDEFECN